MAKKMTMKPLARAKVRQAPRAKTVKVPGKNKGTKVSISTRAAQYKSKTLK